MGAINFIATIFTERDEKVSWANLDIFSWTILTQSGLILFAFPLLGSAIAMLLLDRNFGTMFFASVDGGAILWQHRFRSEGFHPEVYILFLPATGLMSRMLPKFVGRKLFGYQFIGYSSRGLACSRLEYDATRGHDAFGPAGQTSFMAVSIATPFRARSRCSTGSRRCGRGISA